MNILDSNALLDNAAKLGDTIFNAGKRAEVSDGHCKWSTVSHGHAFLRSRSASIPNALLSYLRENLVRHGYIGTLRVADDTRKCP